MTAIALTPWDLCAAAALVVLDAAVSLVLRLHLHRQLVWASGRMVVQLLVVGVLLRFIFALHDPFATLGLVLVMAAIAAREIAARPDRRFRGLGAMVISVPSVVLATVLTLGFALTTAIRPHPWYAPRYAIPLVGIVLGSVLNAGSLALDAILGGVGAERLAIEAQLGLGIDFRCATNTLRRRSIRRGLLPIINQMAAAGVITLPGIMTGQIIAGMDPLEAVKYQLLLMFLLAGASGAAALTVCELALRRLSDHRGRLRLDRLAHRATAE